MTDDSDLTPPAPIPAGLVPLEDVPAFLAVCLGDETLSRPVEIWEHKETGEFRIEPDGRQNREIADQLYEALARYRAVTLDALRLGHLTDLVLPDATHAHPASFWQWPETSAVVETGRWQGQRLAVAADEIRRLAAAIDEARAAQVSADRGAGAQLAAAPAVPGAHPAVHVEKRKRGPKEHWNWELADAEAFNIFAQSNGTMPWKVLVETIQDIAKQQTGKAPSRSTAEEHAARIRDAWLTIQQTTR